MLVFWVSCSDFLCLADVYRFKFDSTVSMARPNISIWAVWALGGGPR